MKLVRICQNCGTAWEPAGLGIGCLRAIWDIILVLGTKGSAVDMAALQNRHDKKDTTCPSCNYTVYREEYIQNTGNQGNSQGSQKNKRWIDK